MEWGAAVCRLLRIAQNFGLSSSVFLRVNESVFATLPQLPSNWTLTFRIHAKREVAQVSYCLLAKQTEKKSQVWANLLKSWWDWERFLSSPIFYVALRSPLHTNTLWMLPPQLFWHRLHFAFVFLPGLGSFPYAESKNTIRRFFSLRLFANFCHILARPCKAYA